MSRSCFARAILFLAASLIGSACAPLATQDAPREPVPPFAETMPPRGYVPAGPLQLEEGSYQASQRDHYNRIYAQPESARPAPNPFLVECLEIIESERRRQALEDGFDHAQSALTALDMGMGDGRNTIALAQQGFRATGFDMSDVGVNRARWRAAELGLVIDARVSYYADDYRRPDAWDVVAIMYFSASDEAFMNGVKQSVKPGGYVIIEYAMSKMSNFALERFLDWEILLYENRCGGRQWSYKQPAQEPGLRMRLLARKPLAGG